MCTLAQKITHIINTIINNKPMNNNTHSNNKVTVMTSLINVLFNSNNPSYQADNEVDAMSNKIQYSNDYDVDLYIKGDYGYSTDTEEQQIADMQWAFEAEIDALYGEHDDEVSLSADTMAIILAYAAEGAAKARANSVNEEDAMYEGEDMSEEDMEALLETLKGLDETKEDAMCNDNCPVCENGVSTNMLCSACEETMLNESYVDKHGSDMEDDMNNDEDTTMLSIMPVLAFAADTTYATMTTNDKAMLIFALVFITVAVVATVVGCLWHEAKQKADKLSKQVRTMAAEQEQQRMHDAFYMMERRERNASYYRQQAAEAAERAEQNRLRLIEIAAEKAAKDEADRQRYLDTQMKDHMHMVNILNGNINWGANDEVIFAQKAEQDKVDELIKAILEMTNEEIWKTYDKANEEKMTAKDLAEAHEKWIESGDNSFFYKHLSIQGLRKFWILQYDNNTWTKQLSINNYFYMVMGAISMRLMMNEKNIYAFYRAASFDVGALANGAMRILTRMEYEAMLLVSKRNYDIVIGKDMQFFMNWQMPTNDAATGGLLLAMSKDQKFAEEMKEDSYVPTFWKSQAMNKEKSLWKAAQWKVYLARYKSVAALKDSMWPMFAKEEVATGKLTNDIVVGFNFEGEKHEICDVADTCSIAKILAAGYDQVLRIRRTDAKGIWTESQQINKKYTGNFCTGAGQVQEHGYYQSKFLQGHYIPWVADIQVNGEWDNFGVILINNSGVVDYGMGNNNRSKKHEQILYRMFGKGNQNEIPTAGQNMLNEMMNNWFNHREFNINHAAAEIKAKLAAAVNNNVW